MYNNYFNIYNKNRTLIFKYNNNYFNLKRNNNHCFILKQNNVLYLNDKNINFHKLLLESNNDFLCYVEKILENFRRKCSFKLLLLKN